MTLLDLLLDDCTQSREQVVRVQGRGGVLRRAGRRRDGEGLVESGEQSEDEDIKQVGVETERCQRFERAAVVVTLGGSGQRQRKLGTRSRQSREEEREREAFNYARIHSRDHDESIERRVIVLVAPIRVHQDFVDRRDAEIDFARREELRDPYEREQALQGG